MYAGHRLVVLEPSSDDLGAASLTFHLRSVLLVDPCTLLIDCFKLSNHLFQLSRGKFTELALSPSIWILAIKALSGGKSAKIARLSLVATSGDEELLASENVSLHIFKCRFLASQLLLRATCLSDLLSYFTICLLHSPELLRELLELAWIILDQIDRLEFLILLIVDPLIAFYICLERLLFALKLPMLRHKFIHLLVADRARVCINFLAPEELTLIPRSLHRTDCRC